MLSGQVPGTHALDVQCLVYGIWGAKPLKKTVAVILDLHVVPIFNLGLNPIPEDPAYD
jgi:hypothetical protein